VTVRKSFEVSGYAVCCERIELIDIRAQRCQWPKRPCDTKVLLRDMAVDSEWATKEKEGEHWEVAEPEHVGLLLRSGCYALLVYTWMKGWWSCSHRLYDHMCDIDCIAWEM